MGLHTVKGDYQASVHSSNEERSAHEIASGDSLVFSEIQSFADLVLRKEIGLKEDSPGDELAHEQGSETSEELIEGLTSNTAEKLIITQTLLVIGHEVDFGSLNGAGKASF